MSGGHRFHRSHHSTGTPPDQALTAGRQTIDRSPVRVHTVYEVENTASFDEAFGNMRAPHRYASNAEWDHWVGNAITWQDATSFRPIFRYPG